MVPRPQPGAPGEAGWQAVWNQAGAALRWTGRREGDLGPAAGEGMVEARRRRILPLPWTVLRQVHGCRVVTVSEPGGCRGEAADAAVTRAGGAALAVLTADCAPVALASPEGVIGVAHAGWRGLEAGVIEATVEAMRRLGARRVSAVLGPCIRPECYEFDAPELDLMVRRYGQAVRATDVAGRPALDLPAVVAAGL